jgi:hypothetical protein
LEYQETLDYVAAAEFLGIPERVLREWVQWDFRNIPYHKLGSGKKADIGFFKDELDMWFKRNGGNFLKDKVQERPGRPRDDFRGNKDSRRGGYSGGNRQPYRRGD